MHRLRITLSSLLLALVACQQGDTTLPEVLLEFGGVSPVVKTGPIKLVANASDNAGVARVEFYRVMSGGNQKLGEDGSAPFELSYNVTAADNGELVFLAKAFDTSSNNKESQTVKVQVNIETVAPTLALTPSTTTVNVAGSLTLTAAASDAGGVQRIEFFQGEGCGTKLNEKQFAPTQPSAQATFVPALSSAENGTVKYSARAHDGSGNSSACQATASIAVNIPGTGTVLKVTIDRSVISNASQAIDVKLNGPGFNNQALSQTQTFDVQPGTYTVNAGVVANRYTPTVTGSPATLQSGQNKEILVVYADDAQKPTVSLQPTGSVSVVAPGSVSFQATANDNLGIAKVEFYLGGNKVSEDTTAPYQFVTQSFGLPQNGQSFSYQAKAIDFAGNASDLSPTTTININIPALQQLGNEVSLGTVADAGIGQPALAVGGSNVFLAHTAANDSDNSSDVVVRKLSGAVWTLEGTSLDSVGASGQSPSATGPSPYVAFSEFYAADKVYVKRLNSGVWDVVGGALNENANNNAREVKLALRSNQPVVAFSELTSGQLQDVLVKEWTGSIWRPLDGVTAGLKVNSGIEASSPAIGVTGSGQVVVAYLENAKTVRVKRWNGSSWQSLGSTLNLDVVRKADSPALAVIGSDIVVAFLEQNSSNKFQLHVKRWDESGSQWQLLSGTGLNQSPTANALGPKIVVDALGRVTVVWVENKSLFMKHFTQNSWSLLGGTSLNVRSTFTASDPDLVLSGNSPVVAWREYNLVNQGTAVFAEIYLQVKQANVN